MARGSTVSHTTALVYTKGPSLDVRMSTRHHSEVLMSGGQDNLADGLAPCLVR